MAAFYISLYCMYVSVARARFQMKYHKNEEEEEGKAAATTKNELCASNDHSHRCIRRDYMGAVVSQSKSNELRGPSTRCWLGRRYWALQKADGFCLFFFLSLFVISSVRGVFGICVRPV